MSVEKMKMALNTPNIFQDPNKEALKSKNYHSPKDATLGQDVFFRHYLSSTSGGQLLTNNSPFPLIRSPIYTDQKYEKKSKVNYGRSVDGRCSSVSTFTLDGGPSKVHSAEKIAPASEINAEKVFQKISNDRVLKVDIPSSTTSQQRQASQLTSKYRSVLPKDLTCTAVPQSHQNYSRAASSNYDGLTCGNNISKGYPVYRKNIPYSEMAPYRPLNPQSPTVSSSSIELTLINLNTNRHVRPNMSVTTAPPYAANHIAGKPMMRMKTNPKNFIGGQFLPQINRPISHLPYMYFDDPKYLCPPIQTASPSRTINNDKPTFVRNPAQTDREFSQVSEMTTFDVDDTNGRLVIDEERDKLENEKPIWRLVPQMTSCDTSEKVKFPWMIDGFEKSREKERGRTITYGNSNKRRKKRRKTNKNCRKCGTLLPTINQLLCSTCKRLLELKRRINKRMKELRAQGVLPRQRKPFIAKEDILHPDYIRKMECQRSQKEIKDGDTSSRKNQPIRMTLVSCQPIDVDGYDKRIDNANTTLTGGGPISFQKIDGPQTNDGHNQARKKRKCSKIEIIPVPVSGSNDSKDCLDIFPPPKSTKRIRRVEKRALRTITCNIQKVVSISLQFKRCFKDLGKNGKLQSAFLNKLFIDFCCYYLREFCCMKASYNNIFRLLSRNASSLMELRRNLMKFPKSLMFTKLPLNSHTLKKKVKKQTMAKVVYLGNKNIPAVPSRLQWLFAEVPRSDNSEKSNLRQKLSENKSVPFENVITAKDSSHLASCGSFNGILDLFRIRSVGPPFIYNESAFKNIGLQEFAVKQSVNRSNTLPVYVTAKAKMATATSVSNQKERRDDSNLPKYLHNEDVAHLCNVVKKTEANRMPTYDSTKEFSQNLQNKTNPFLSNKEANAVESSASATNEDDVIYLNSVIGGITKITRKGNVNNSGSPVHERLVQQNRNSQKLKTVREQLYEGRLRILKNLVHDYPHYKNTQRDLVTNMTSETPEDANKILNTSGFNQNRDRIAPPNNEFSYLFRSCNVPASVEQTSFFKNGDHSGFGPWTQPSANAIPRKLYSNVEDVLAIRKTMLLNFSMNQNNGNERDNLQSSRAESLNSLESFPQNSKYKLPLPVKPAIDASASETFRSLKENLHKTRYIDFLTDNNNQIGSTSATPKCNDTTSKTLPRNVGGTDSSETLAFKDVSWKGKNSLDTMEAPSSQVNSYQTASLPKSGPNYDGHVSVSSSLKERDSMNNGKIQELYPLTFKKTEVSSSTFPEQKYPLDCRQLLLLPLQPLSSAMRNMGCLSQGLPIKRHPVFPNYNANDKNIQLMKDTCERESRIFDKNQPKVFTADEPPVPQPFRVLKPKPLKPTVIDETRSDENLPLRPPPKLIPLQPVLNQKELLALVTQRTRESQSFSSYSEKRVNFHCALPNDQCFQLHQEIPKNTASGTNSISQTPMSAFRKCCSSFLRPDEPPASEQAWHQQDRLDHRSMDSSLYCRSSETLKRKHESPVLNHVPSSSVYYQTLQNYALLRNGWPNAKIPKEKATRFNSRLQDNY